MRYGVWSALIVSYSVGRSKVIVLAVLRLRHAHVKLCFLVSDQYEGSSDMSGELFVNKDPAQRNWCRSSGVC
jgi:hypothetical protein